MKNTIKIKRNWSSPSLLPKSLVFIDGVTRSGKSMIGPVVSSFTKTYPVQFQTIIDNLMPIYKQKSIRHDVLTSMLNFYFNQNVYNLNISRQINLRKDDINSLVNDKNAKEYLKNLKIKDGDYIIKKIKEKNHSLAYQTHDLLSMIIELNKLNYPYKLIYIYRNPIDNIFSCYKRYQLRLSSKLDDTYNIDDPRIFQMMIKTNGKLFPYYTRNQENKFLKLNFLEKVIFYYLFSIKNSIKSYKKLNKTQKMKILLIQYDSFATNTNFEIRKLTNFLNVRTTAHTKKILKKNNLPRKIGKNDRDYKLNIIKKNINSDLFKEVLKMTKKYEPSELFT
tara:strand:- start:446 stop:1450 length:1005 start_codon:yes stop_codon:yes gene_type:complete